jgi:luciferase family oxidoreductase group 1
MLPNQAPLVVAEQFGTLEALHPGRIDLGIGRAPGTDQVTALALRRSPEALAADDFPQQLGELLAFFNGTFPDTHSFRAITAVPGYGDQPELWLLGSSGFSAQLAGLARAPVLLRPPLQRRQHPARPRPLPVELPSLGHSGRAPRHGGCVSVICAETDEQAQWLAGPSKLAFVRLRSGRPGRLPTPEEAAAHDYSPSGAGHPRRPHQRSDRGGPRHRGRRVGPAVGETKADELMVTAMIHGYGDRVRSYELVADIAAGHRLPPVAPSPSPA